MHNLLPALPNAISNVMDSLPYFIPEIYLTVLFLLVLITDLLFGENSQRLCRMVAYAGICVIIGKDFNQLALLVNGHSGSGYLIFGEMLLLRQTAVDFKIVIDVLAFILLLYFEWDDKLDSHTKGLSDLYTIAIGSVLGLHLMIMAVNLLSVYLAIELVSIASYLMVAYRSENSSGTEAGLKYVLFGAASSAIMLYGISLLYAYTGSLNFFTGNLLPGLMQVNSIAVTFALVLTLAGVGFKLSFVPMHFWVPDVYEGASTPVTAWLSTLPKIAGFGLLLNILTTFIINSQWRGLDFRLVLSVIGIVSMIAGNFAAVFQNNIKRMLAYSSIGHTGFALMAMVTFTQSGFSSLIFYLAVYGLANIGALMLVSYFSNIIDSTNADSYKGLGHKFPVASVAFVVLLISLTGLPVSAGFIGKVFVFSSVYALYQQQHSLSMLLLLVTGAVTTVIALFYYIRIPLNLFLKRSENAINISIKFNKLLIAASIICILIILLGIWPNLILKSL